MKQLFSFLLFVGISFFLADCRKNSYLRATTMKEIYWVKYDTTAARWDTIIRPPDEQITIVWINPGRSKVAYADRIQVYRGDRMIADALPSVMTSDDGSIDYSYCGEEGSFVIESIVLSNVRKYLYIYVLPNEAIYGRYRAIGTLIDVAIGHGKRSICDDFIVLQDEQ